MDQGRTKHVGTSWGYTTYLTYLTYHNLSNLSNFITIDPALLLGLSELFGLVRYHLIDACYTIVAWEHPHFEAWHPPYGDGSGFK